MALTLLACTALLAAQSATVLAPEAEVFQQADAAYEELSAGNTAEAIARLEAALQEAPGDPSLLINLGTAYSRVGRMEDAREAFRSAMASEQRYQLELADGRWEDSRLVARIALNSLEERGFAAR